MKRTTALKALMARRTAAILPGAPNALFARVAEDAGFEAIYITGAGIANMYLGAPDIGLTTMTELVSHVDAIADATNAPLLVDGDTGFGNAINVRRVVRSLERAGAAGIQLEDQDFPKKCGHFSGKAVIPKSEMVQKIRAAVDSRHDGDFQIIARTDAIAIEGIEAALDRAHAYIEAGADVTFVEAPRTIEDIRRIPRELPVPQILNLVHGGRTPPVEQAEIAEMGYAAVLYANAALQGALHAVAGIMGHLRKSGSLTGITDQLASFESRQNSVSKPFYDELEARYSGGTE